MPFTISHAGFVLPFKRFLSAPVLCGIVIGSMVPDFPYFVREFRIASLAHTLVGTFCVSLPIGMMIYLLVSLFIKRVAYTLPKPHSSFFASWGIDKTISKRNLPRILIAILLGALSHNFIDSFTHESGIAVSIFPFLSKEMVLIDDEPIHVFSALQYLGSVLGLAIILVSYWNGLIRFCSAKGYSIWQDSRGWLILLGMTIATMLIAAAVNMDTLPRSFDLYAIRVFAFKFLITWLPTIGVAFLCLSVLRSGLLTTKEDE